MLRLRLGRRAEFGRCFEVHRADRQQGALAALQRAAGRRDPSQTQVRHQYDLHDHHQRRDVYQQQHSRQCHRHAVPLGHARIFDSGNPQRRGRRFHVPHAHRRIGGDPEHGLFGKPRSLQRCNRGDEDHDPRHGLRGHGRRRRQGRRGEHGDCWRAGGPVRQRRDDPDRERLYRRQWRLQLLQHQRSGAGTGRHVRREGNRSQWVPVHGRCQ